MLLPDFTRLFGQLGVEFLQVVSATLFENVSFTNHGVAQHFNGVDKAPCGAAGSAVAEHQDLGQRVACAPQSETAGSGTARMATPSG